MQDAVIPSAARNISYALGVVSIFFLADSQQKTNKSDFRFMLNNFLG